MELPGQEVAVANAQQPAEVQTTVSRLQHVLHLKALLAHRLVGVQGE